MATYNVPGQNLTYNIPESGQYFRALGNDQAVFKNVGDGTVQQINLSDLAKTANPTLLGGGNQTSAGREMVQNQYGINVMSLPEYNMGDFQQAGGSVYGSKFNISGATNDLGSFFGGLDVNKNATLNSGTAYTQTVNPDNPYGALVTDQSGNVVRRSASLAQALGSAGATPQQIASMSASAATNKGGAYTNAQLGAAGAIPTAQSIQQGATSVVNGYGPSSYTGGSVVDYLGSLGKPTDFNSRATLAKQFGIANYAGTAEQNTQLLTKLRSLGATTANTTPGSMTATGMGGGTSPINLGTNSSSSSSIATSIVAGAEASQKSINDYIKMLAGDPSETQKRYDAILAQIEGLLPSQGGRGAAQAAEEAARGVDALKMALATVNGQIGVKMEEYRVLNEANENKPITMSSIIGSQRAIETKMASDIGLLQAQALGLQGQLEAAQEAADRAVDLKFADASDALQLRMSQLQLLEGSLSKEEKNRADAIQMYLQDKQQALEAQKAAAKEATSFALDAMSKYISAGINISDDYATVQKKIQGSREYQIEMQNQTRLAGGGGSSGAGNVSTTGTPSANIVKNINQYGSGEQFAYDPATGEFGPVVAPTINLGKLTPTQTQNLTQAGLSGASNDIKSFYLNTESAFQDHINRSVASSVIKQLSFSELQELYSDWQGQKSGGIANPFK